MGHGRSAALSTATSYRRLVPQIARTELPPLTELLVMVGLSNTASGIGVDFLTDSKDGIATAHGTVGDGGPFKHSVWHWGGFSHFGLGWFKDGNKENPCEKYPFNVMRNWWGEDGAHIWSSNTVTGAEGAWAGEIKCVAEYFKKGSAIMEGKIVGQYPSHWVATKRSDKEIDVRGLVTLKVEGGGT